MGKEKGIPQSPTQVVQKKERKKEKEDLAHFFFAKEENHKKHDIKCNVNQTFIKVLL